jgi:hypothetical protein
MYLNGGGANLGRGSFPAVVAGSNAITVNDGTLSTFKDLYITNCSDKGIFINGISSGDNTYGHRVDRCYIANCTVGVCTSGSQGQYTKNQIKYNKIGMQLVGATGSIGASANTINNNEIGYNWWDGLELSSSTTGSLTVYRNNIHSNQFDSNSIDADNAHSHIAMWGQLTQGNFITANNFWTENGVAQKPAYGIYMDNLVNANIVTNNEAWYAARNTANNIKCTFAGGTNMNPNRIRWNQSQCSAPNGSSYDA